MLLLFVGCDTVKNLPRPLAKTATLELHVVTPSEAPSAKLAVDPSTNELLYLQMPAVITAADVESVQRSRGFAADSVCDRESHRGGGQETGGGHGKSGRDARCLRRQWNGNGGTQSDGTVVGQFSDLRGRHCQAA